MENVELNMKAVQVLAEWDPFNLGPDSYDTETADVVAALQGIDDAKALADVIQKVYEYSYEQWIPAEKCLKIATQLVGIKYEEKCNL